MKPVYLLWQWLWGLPQNLAGLCLMLRHRKERHVWYHGSYMTFFHTWCGGVSLGMFTFVSEYDERMKEAFAREGSRLTESYHRQLMVHEYGHTIQSLLLGPLYLLAVGLPSMVWCRSGKCRRYRAEKGISYYDFWCEKWANTLGEKVTGEYLWSDKTKQK